MHVRWSDPPAVEQVGAADPVSYVLIAGPSGELEGALYLNLVDNFLGFIPKQPVGPRSRWTDICLAVIRHAAADGREAFAHWRDPANETVETYTVSDIRQAVNLDALRALISAL